MKKVVLIIAMLFLAVTSSINVQAKALPVTNNTKDIVSDSEPLWWSCEKWGAQMATNAGYEFDTLPWYHAKNGFQAWCMNNVSKMQ